MRSQKTFTLLVILMCMFLMTTAVLPNKTLKVGKVTANAGEKKDGYIIVPAGKDGPETVIPITVINGVKDGPVLALIAAIHGYEYPPVLALQRLSKKLNPSTLTGAVILVHVANMPSFLKRTVYYNPNDWKNLNRVFPGKIDGTQCERIAYQITNEVIKQCDVLIDNHCGDGNEDLMPYLYCTKIGNPEVDKKTRELAVNYGFKVIVGDLGRPKDLSQSVYCGNTALLMGKPSITIESGKLGRTDEEDIVRVVHGTLNILKHLRMIEGKPELICDPVWVEEYTIIQAEHDGLFYPLVSRGHHVQKGELIGYLTDFFGNRIQEVKSPYDGMILYVIATPPMSKGEPMTSVGRFK